MIGRIVTVIAMFLFVAAVLPIFLILGIIVGAVAHLTLIYQAISLATDILKEN